MLLQLSLHSFLAIILSLNAVNKSTMSSSENSLTSFKDMPFSEEKRNIDYEVFVKHNVPNHMLAPILLHIQSNVNQQLNLLRVIVKLKKVKWWWWGGGVDVNSKNLIELELMFMKHYAPNRCLYLKVAKLRTGMGSAEMSHLQNCSDKIFKEHFRYLKIYTKKKKIKKDKKNKLNIFF